MLTIVFVAFWSALVLRESVGSPGRNNTEVVVDVSNIKHQQGKLVFCIFNKREGFPTEINRALATQTTAIEGTAAQATFKDLVAGDYFISVFHDENGNGKPDRNFIGLPKEGIGTSNNILKGALKPNFDKARIRLNAGSQRVAVELRYF